MAKPTEWASAWRSRSALARPQARPRTVAPPRRVEHATRVRFAATRRKHRCAHGGSGNHPHTGSFGESPKAARGSRAPPDHLHYWLELGHKGAARRGAEPFSASTAQTTATKATESHKREKPHPVKPPASLPSEPARGSRDQTDPCDAAVTHCPEARPPRKGEAPPIPIAAPALPTSAGSGRAETAFLRHVSG